MKRKIITIINLPFDLASPKSGACRGPAALGNLDLSGMLKSCGHEVVSSSLDEQSRDCVLQEQEKSENIDQLKEVAEFSVQAIEMLDRAYSEGRFPLVIGGDHSISIATISSAVKHLKKEKGNNARLGVLWVDAHPDLNTTETSPSGNVHGMSVAALLGKGDKLLVSVGGSNNRLLPQDVAFIGLRELDAGEIDLIENLNLKTYSSQDVHLNGIVVPVKSVLEYFEQNVDAFVLSFDMDSCDPAIAPGVATPKKGGLTFDQASALMELVGNSEKLMSLEVVELNPPLDDHSGSTSKLALELLKKAFSK